MTTFPRPTKPTPFDPAAFDENVRRGLHDTLAPDDWFQNNVAASQSAILLSRAGPAASTVAFSTTKWVVPGLGALKGVWVKSNAARTAGTLTITVFVNGASVGLTAVLNGTNTTLKLTPYNEALKRLSLGDEVELKITTDGSWAPTTADVVAGILVGLD